MHTSAALHDIQQRPVHKCPHRNTGPDNRNPHPLIQIVMYMLQSCHDKMKPTIRPPALYRAQTRPTLFRTLCLVLSVNRAPSFLLTLGIPTARTWDILRPSLSVGSVRIRTEGSNKVKLTLGIRLVVGVVDRTETFSVGGRVATSRVGRKEISAGRGRGTSWGKVYR